MVRRGAARKEIRQAKRAIARAETGKKKGHRNPIGSTKKIGMAKRNGRGHRILHVAEEEEGAARKVAPADEDEDDMEPRFTRVEKKARVGPPTG